MATDSGTSPAPGTALAASCPGKIMLAGEYDVLEGGPALLMAVNRRAVAKLGAKASKQTLFLEALRDLLARRGGPQSAACLAAARVQVDTSGFREDGQKLGLGSSAAAMVSATALCLHAGGEPLDVQAILTLARQAHGDAQATLGARGSGADIATCALGNTLLFQEGRTPQALQLPTELALVFPWTGVSASTAKLVAAVHRFARLAPEAYFELCGEIRAACQALQGAGTCEQAIEALRAGGQALQRLTRGARVPLWLPVHSQLAERAETLGGSLKPTGAGGGDLALAAFPSIEAARSFRQEVKAMGIVCPPLALDTQGVRLHS